MMQGTVGAHLRLRAKEIVAHAGTLAPNDGSSFNPPLLNVKIVFRALERVARSRGFNRFGSKLRAPGRVLLLDLAADKAEQKLYERSFGEDATLGQRMQSEEPGKTCNFGPAKWKGRYPLKEVLVAQREFSGARWSRDEIL